MLIKILGTSSFMNKPKKFVYNVIKNNKKPKVIDSSGAK